ncbi:MAG: hypothetical protein IKN87_05885 [Bacilli bacterium]|nr:hypothetical protein [Bacilli bacterium]
MSKADVLKKFEDEFVMLSLFDEKLHEAEKYYEEKLRTKKVFRLTKDEKQNVIVYYDLLVDYNQKVEKFLGNQKYADLVKETNDDSLINAINVIKSNLIKNGLMIEKYLRVIKSQPSLFMHYFDGKIQKRGTYDRDITNQYRKSMGYTALENYSISEFYHWVTSQKIIGEDFIQQLSDIEKNYNLKFGELNKGLYDSLFIGHKNWKLITPNSYTFDALDQSNVIKGSLVYECGTAIKDNYKTMNVPSTIDTIVLHNPYNKKECDTLSLVSDEMNVILSFFGYVTDKDYAEKLELYNKYLAAFANNKNGDVIQLSQEKNKQYVKTVVSLKK